MNKRNNLYNKGITLIALIITIIVMLILVGVTINVAINGGLITVTQEAKFKTEVRQIEEGLQVRKAVLLAENLGTLENITSITIGELDIDQKLKTKYAEKLIISKESDDFVLYYNSEKVTSQEIEWLEELGIRAGVSTGTDILEDARIAYNTYKNTLYNGNFTDFCEIYDDIKTKHPTAAIFYYDTTNLFKKRGIQPSYFTYFRSNNIKTCVEVIEKLEDEYSNPDIQVPSTTKQEVKEMLVGTGVSIETCQTVKDIINKMENTLEEFIEYQEFENYLVIKGNTKVLISKDGASIFNEDIPIINEQEQNNPYIYTVRKDDDGYSGISQISLGTITGYNGNDSVVEIPSVIIQEDGTEIFVEKIASNALATTKNIKKAEMPTILLEQVMNIFGTTYNEVTVSELASILSQASMLGAGVSTEGYEDTREGKNRFLLDNMLSAYIPSGANVDDYIDLEGTGDEQQLFAYISLDSNGIPTFYEKTDDYVVAIESLIISEGITELGDTIIAGNIVADLYLPESLESASETALANCRIVKIRTGKTRSQLEDLCGGGSSLVFGSTIPVDDCEFLSD